jgi:hypothetical protein
MIRVEDSYSSKCLIKKEASEEYKQLIVQIILKVTAGHAKSE